MKIGTIKSKEARNRHIENEYYFQNLSMRKFALSLFAAFSLFTPLLVTGCQMGSQEKTEEHDYKDDHKDDHKGHHHGHDH